MIVGVCRLIANHLHLAFFRKHTRGQGPSLHRHYPASTVILPCPTPADAAARSDVEAATLAPNGSPPITRTTFPTCRAHYPGGSSGCLCRLLPRITQPSPNGRRVGIRIVTFEACSGFTHVTARRIAHSRPQATFVTRLQPMRLPAQAARQLPDQSTTLRWIPPPLMIRAFRAHCHQETHALQQERSDFRRLRPRALDAASGCRPPHQ